MPQLVKQNFLKELYFLYVQMEMDTLPGSVIYNHFKSYFKKSEFLIVGANNRFFHLRSLDKVIDKSLLPTNSISEVKGWKAFLIIWKSQKRT